ncbi:DpnI domain-containing protein [Thermanaerothrix sp.]|uniref:DpnI domain-containing protein n=1 Tax=Thermanaerothrix sp. TaxID=2972675 RepID=UPI003A0FB964
MDVDLSKYLTKVAGYKSASQKARILTEAWASDNLECPSCGGALILLPPNSRASDLQCRSCGETYQLKSRSKPFGKKILGAEYNTTIQAVRGGSHPSLILLRYDPSNLTVQQVRILHRSWITEQSIIPRCPLSSQARRAGWQGCLLSIDAIPSIAFVDVVQDGVIIPTPTIQAKWKIAHSISALSFAKRGWLFLVLRIAELLPREFSLQDMYAYEGLLAKLYPANKNIRAKIRQQLQIARGLGLIQFVGQGLYRRIS